MPITYNTLAGGGTNLNVPGQSLGGTTTSGAGGLGGGMDFLLALAKRKADQEAAMRSLQLEKAIGAKTPLAGINYQDPEYQMAQEKLKQERAKTEAMTQTVPKKLMTGFNIIPGWVDDTSAMSPMQRQMLLPQNAGMVSGPSDQGAGGEDFGRFAKETQPGGSRYQANPTSDEPIAEMAKRMYGDVDWQGKQAEDERRQKRLLAAYGSSGLGTTR